MIELRQDSDALAEYIAAGGNYRPYAKELGLRHSAFLEKANDPAEIERAAILSDRQLDRIWRLRPVYEGEDGAVIGDPGEAAADEVRPELTGYYELDAEAEWMPELPMSIPKADGRGKQSQYFGFHLDLGGGQRWHLSAFDTPLRAALGGLLNRELGFGGSDHVDEAVSYCGDGFHWGRKKRLAPRTLLDRNTTGPVCRVLSHPEPQGRWYAWLGKPFDVPKTSKWEAWLKRANVFEQERKKSRIGKRTLPAAIPYISGNDSAANPEQSGPTNESKAA